MQSFHFKIMEKFLMLALLISMSLTIILAATDKTLEEKAVGKDVVEAVEAKIKKAQIFTREDNEFFRRLAYIESRDGESNSTFVPATFFGGIWQVNERYFNLTKNSSLVALHQKINSTLTINWPSVQWRDLLKPLYSGLAARLYVNQRLAAGEEIPQTIAEQGYFFDRIYNHRDDMNNSTFVIGVEELENNTETCSGKMDMVIVMDGSSSVTEENFKLCRNFLVDLMGTFSLETVRHGLVLYSTVAETVFDLDHGLTFAELKNKTLGIPYPNERTDTNAALLEVLSVFDRSTPRRGVPQVMSIFTDGQSTSPGVSNIQYVQARNISSYVIGITNLVNLAELEELAYNIQNNVFALDNFQVLAEFFKRLNAETCKLPQKPDLDSPTEDSLKQGERRYYEFSVPPEGLTLSTFTNEGKTRGYYSFTEKNPSSALCDGELRWEGVYISPNTNRFFLADDDADMINADMLAADDDAEEVVVYVSVQGVETFNNYTIEALTGDEVQNTTTTEPTTTTQEDDTTSTTDDGSGSTTLEQDTDSTSTTDLISDPTTTTEETDTKPTTDGSGSSSLISSAKIILLLFIVNYFFNRNQN